MSKEDGAPDLKPVPSIAPDVWTNFTMSRKSGRTIVHTSEMVDGVLFVAVLLYGEDGRLEGKNLIRGDLVRG